MDEEEKSQVVSSVTTAVKLVGTKNTKKGVNALIKLTSAKEYMELAAEEWIKQGGATKAMDFLDNVSLEEEKFHDMIENFLRLVTNVVKMEKFIEPLVELQVVECVLRILAFSPITSLISKSLKLIGLLSCNASAMKILIEANAITEIMDHVSITNDTFLTSVLPRLLKDQKMADLFCDHGGLGFLQSVFVFQDEGSMEGRAGGVASVSLLAKMPKTLQKMINEDEFVACFMSMLSAEGASWKLKVHVIKTLYLFAIDQVGMMLVEPAVLPLMEVIESVEESATPAIVASFELLSLLCSTRDGIDQVSVCGGSEFVEYLLCFLSSSNIAVIEPLCGLLHVLALGGYRDMIVKELEGAQEVSSDCKEMIEMTLDLIGGRKKAATRAQEASTEAVEDLGVAKKLPAVRLRNESNTARQGAKRLNIMKEIQSTERTYCMALFSVVKCFIDPMKKLVSTPKAVVTEKDLEIMFGNMEAIYTLHKDFMKKLDKTIKASSDPKVGDLFLELGESLLDTYKPYYENYPKAVELVDLKEKKTKGFRQLCTNLTKKVVRGGLSLDNYLIMPIQRLPRYAMLLKELAKVTVDSHPDKQTILSACALVEQKVAIIDGDDTVANVVSSNAQDKRLSRMSVLSPKKNRMSEMLFRSSSKNLDATSPIPASPVKRKTLMMSSNTKKDNSRASVSLKGSGRVKVKEKRHSLGDEEIAAAMVYSGPDNVANTEVQSVSSPILAEGSVRETVLPDDGSVHSRKFLLLKDKLVVMSTGAATRNGGTQGDVVICLPTTVHTFPLTSLRIEKEEDGKDPFAIRLVDTRKGDDGSVFVCETEVELNRWLTCLLEAIYSN